MKSRTVNLLIALVVVTAVVTTAVVVAGTAHIRQIWDDITHQTSSNTNAAYCNQVAAKQPTIGTIASSGDSQTALITALPIFESLASAAPADISASWTALDTAIAGLKSAIAATGHQPTDFANGTFPKDVTAAQRQAVVDAADTLGSSTTTTALTSIVQEVRDVCQVDLDL